MSLFLSPKSHLAVVLIEPQIPQNTGNIARLCTCTGTELYLIGTLGFRVGEKHFARAGMDYLDHLQIQHLPSYDALLAQKPGWQALYFSAKGQRNLWEVAFAPQTLLVFGSETQGLPAPWLAAHASQTVRLPMVDTARCLNLATSVGIGLYEALRQLNRP
jgi:tRNA (cytidine/uridine-2'-O-)-methyltransferase